MEKNKQKTLKILTFGFFDILIDEESVIHSFGSSKKTLALFKYFVGNIGQKLPTHKIMDANFGEYKYSDPGNTLRGHIHRLRTVLNNLNKQIGSKALSVDHVADYYIFTVGEHCKIDFVDFLDAIQEEPTHNEAGKKNVEIVKNLYRGDFLLDVENMEWVNPIRYDFHRRFMRYMVTYLEALYEDGAYEDLVVEADSVMERLFFDENFQEVYIKALVALDKEKEATDHIAYMTQRYTNEVGAAPSDKVAGLIKRLQSTNEAAQNVDLFTMEKLVRQSETGANSGVFISSKEFFMDLYRLEIRRKKRHDDRITIVGIMNVATADFRDMKQTEIKEVQDKLSSLISRTIRSQDVMTILNDSQIAFMLFDAIESTVSDVDDRMKKELDKIKKAHSLVITITYKTIISGNEYSKELML